VRRLIAFLVLLSALAVTGACGTSRSPESSGSGQGTVTVAHAPSTLFAPLYVAQAKGYFNAAGLKVKLETIKAGQDAIPLAANGKVDAVVAGFSAGMFNALHSGLEIKVVGSMGMSTGDPKASPTALEVSKQLVNSGMIKSPADLRKRKVAVSGGAGAAGGYQLDTILRQSGLTLKDVELVNLGFPDMEAAIAGGSTAAALPPAPFTTKMEQSGVAVALGVPPKGTTATGIIYGGRFAKTPAAQRFFNALARAAQDLQGEGAKSNDVLKILADATGQQATVLRDVPSYEWRPDLAPLGDQLQAQQRAYLDAGLLDYDEPLATDTFVVTSFAARAGTTTAPA
jgi:NitT/TauT family transport system substrate-binding protein